MPRRHAETPLVMPGWVRGNSKRYQPSAVPSLWRKVADLPTWEDAARRYGPLERAPAPDESWEDWPTLHGRLVAVARLWRPDETVACFDRSSGSCCSRTRR
jgi:hypothetical protein